MENMLRCITWYLPTSPIKVVDLGSASVNGSYREILPDTAAYVGVDLAAGPGVDIVLIDPYHLPFPDGSIDLILSGQMLEHCGQFWRVFAEIERVLSPEGLAFMIAPSAGPVHRFPLDCYRFYPDSYAAIAEWSGLRLVQSWTDERGPWRDLVGVFQKGDSLKPRCEPPAAASPGQFDFPIHRDPAAEITRGMRSYLSVLMELHDVLTPRGYLEIGVRKGASLALSSAPTVAIDPVPDLNNPASNVTLYRCTSDDFFFFHGDAVAPGSIDLAFIDGMHLAEYVYRDFLYVERIMSPNGVIVIDDVLPNHPVQALRKRQSRVWMGDVWRFAMLLLEKRPDLRLTWLDTSPGGLLVISCLSPNNRTLWDIYNPTLRKWSENADELPPSTILSRRDAVAPTSAALRKAVNLNL